MDQQAHPTNVDPNMSRPQGWQQGNPGDTNDLPRPGSNPGWNQADAPVNTQKPNKNNSDDPNSTRNLHPAIADSKPFAGSGKDVGLVNPPIVSVNPSSGDQLEGDGKPIEGANFVHLPKLIPLRDYTVKAVVKGDKVTGDMQAPSDGVVVIRVI